MIRSILEPLLQRFGAATVHSAPTRYEIVLGHVAYLVGLGLIAQGAARLAGYAPPTSVGGLVGTGGAFAALGFLFLYRAVIGPSPIDASPRTCGSYPTWSGSA